MKKSKKINFIGTPKPRRQPRRDSYNNRTMIRDATGALIGLAVVGAIASTLNK